MRDPATEFEHRVADLLGGEVVPGSGAGKWVKLDARGVTILASCKWTQHGSRSLSPVEYDEAVRAVRGPGGVKGDIVPALAIGLGDRTFIVQDPSDWSELVIVRDPIHVAMDRSEQRRHDAGTTPLMRRED